jgi:hypothetical protein
MLIHCCRDVFTAQLRSNARGAYHRKHCSSIVARVRFRWNVFTESLPSSELFRLSGIMSQYSLGTDRIENIASNSFSIVACVSVATIA